ncbi:hypothetical protein P186_0913 [Pyrobaculum ferrireducens]|uniref:Uncharacterized protein n=2 Tax=Pyrobaculum ferrireducens TaxID=1104324 RepID=G7VB44_9CREN|nr:hypothetical protein P186_0913 [Pyrobaculum ferrireducens]
MGVLFRGYLYMLIYVIGAGLAMVAVLYAMVMSAVWSALHGRGFDFWGFLAAFIAVVVLFTVGVLVIFFRYHFRGFMALYRLGFKVAWLLAWGPVITLILMAAIIGVVVVSAPAVLFRGDILGALAAGVAVMALLAAAFAVGFAVLVARLALLRGLYRYTGINLFNIAFVLALVGLVFYAAYYLYILTYSRPYGFAAPGPAVGLAALGGIVSIAAYIVEMIAYKEGSEWTPKAQPTAPA